MAEGCTDTSATTGVEGSGTCLPQFLRQTRRLSAFQEKRTARSLSLSRSQADQARPDELAPVPAQARLGAVPQQPHGARRAEERHGQPLLWQVVREHPD